MAVRSLSHHLIALGQGVLGPLAETQAFAVRILGR